MSIALIAAAALAAAIGAAHSILGERFILIRLFRRDNLPKLFGTDVWTKRILRMAWHVTTVAWLGFAALLLVIAADGPVDRTDVAAVVAFTFAASAAAAAIGSRGRHPAWIVFLAIAALSWVGA